MSQRTVSEINQYSLTSPPVQNRSFSIQIELPASDCQSLGLDSLLDSSDNLELTEVGVKRQSSSRSGSPRPGQHSGKHWKSDSSPTGRCKLDSTFQSVETQTLTPPGVAVETQTSQSVRSFWTQTLPITPVVHSPIRTPEHSPRNHHHYGHS